jgi:hypothetical protein
VDRSHLPAADPEAKGREGFLDDQADYEEIARGRPVAHWFLLAAAGLLFVELLFQLWFRRLAR